MPTEPPSKRPFSAYQRQYISENFIPIQSPLEVGQSEITINFRINFETFFGQRVLEMAFSGFQIWKFSGGGGEHAPTPYP